MHILLIDDEVGVLSNLRMYLTLERHTCAEMRRLTDESTLHTRLDEIKPQAVILDFGMGHEGDEVYGWIRSWHPAHHQTAGRDIRIVFYTCYAESPNHRDRMRQAGAADREIIPKREVGSDIRDLLAVLS